MTLFLPPGSPVIDVRDPLPLVIDVRGRDHEGGHIPGSIHVSTSSVVTNTGYLMAEIRSRKVRTVVFTCMYSVLRARKCCKVGSL